MNSPLNELLVEDLARELFNKYFYNRKYYGKQVKDDSDKVMYLRKRNKISAAVLKNMINSKKSIMSYQQVRQKLKWICIDIDISKTVIDSDFDFFKNNEVQQKLFSVFSKVKETLVNYNINGIYEFSGNRGIHIWIFFDKEVTKNLGYQIINKIVTESLDEEDSVNNEVIIDKYPKNGLAKTNTIGLGVKVPLSFHLKSNRYSYFFQNTDEIKAIETLDNDFLKEQLKIIKAIKINKIDDIVTLFEIKEEIDEDNFKKVNIYSQKNIFLKEIIQVLSKSKIFKTIFEKPIAHLSEKDRVIIVASIVRLKSEENENLGIDLLKEFFSSEQDTYNQELTNEKLNNLKNLYPPNIKYLENRYNIRCEYCNEMKFYNVTDLLKSELNVTINKVENEEFIINKTIRAEKNYLQQNDEVPLTFIKDQLSYLKINEIKKSIDDIYKDEFNNKKVDFYKFIRNESEQKTRVLYSLGASDRVISTVLASKITEFMYGDFSINSYAYRLNKTNKEYIFENWSKAWSDYIYSIESILNDESYDDFYLIKLDIKSFYNSINHITLREVLLERIKLNIDETKIDEIYPIINYFIKLTKTIMESDYGLPQGPAYARVLAEFYLSKLDTTIEDFIDDEFESYFRYVDDVFIIVKNKERFDDIFEKIKISLDILGLDLNTDTDKFQMGLIKDLKYEITSKSIEKYFIDGLEYEETGEELKENAKKILNNLIMNDLNDIDIKELPFYLTHLIDDEIIESKKEQVKNLILSEKFGRGSLYKHFYNNILLANALNDFNLESISNLSGLARSNLFSAIINNYDNVPKKVINYVIRTYFRADNTDYEEIELIRLILLSHFDEENFNFKKNELTIVLDNIKYFDNFSLNETNEREILAQLQYRANLFGLEKSIKELDLFLEKKTLLHSHRKVVETFESIINVSTEKEISKESAQNLANLICFLSLYSKIKIDGFIDMWNKILILGEKHKLNMSEWYKYKAHINWERVEQQQLTMLISDVLNGKAINPRKKVSDLEKEFTSYLLLMILQPKIINGNILDESINLEEIKRIIIQNDITFLKWCIDEETKYYPDSSEVARLNVFYNNRVILRRNNELLIRADSKLENVIDSSKILSDNWFNKDEHINFVLNYGSNQLMNINDKISGKNLISSIIIISKLMKKIDNGEIYNYFEKGVFNNHSDEVYFKYSKLDKYTIINNKTQFKTDSYNLKLNLIKILSDVELIFKSEGIYEYDPSEFLNEFVPNKYRDKELVNFVTDLGEMLESQLDDNQINPFVIENIKITLIKKYMKREKKDINEIEFINRYANLSKNDPNKLIIFNNNGMEINDDNLFSMIDNILEKINFEDFKELNSLYKELVEVKERAKVYLDVDHKKIISLSKSKGINEYLLRIDNQKHSLKKIKVLYPFKHEDLEDILPSDILDLDSRNALYMNENSNIIVAVPLNGLINLKEKIILINNTDLVKKLKEERNSIKSLECYKEAKNIIKKQNDIPDHEATQKLFRFISQFDKKYEESLLKLIASYKVIDRDLCRKYFDNLQEIIKINDEFCVLPLKTKEDDNGFNVMVTTVGRKHGFDRNSEYLNYLINDFNKINQSPSSISTLIIPLDIGLSGTQFKRTIQTYYTRSKTDFDCPKEFYNFEKEVFIKLISNLKKIIIHSVFYTDKFEENINKFFNNIYKDIDTSMPQILISGEKLITQENIFTNKIDYSDRQLIIEAFSDEKFINQVGYVKNKTFKEYLEEIEDNKTSNILIGRYNSMPKIHLTPLTGEMGVFNYRKDT